MDPVVLSANQPPDRFYRGGAQIAEFRGEPRHGHRVPEDWVASTTALAGHEHVGMTVMPGGTRLIDEIAAEPLGWLGPAHLERYGLDTKLLVKLLDAGERLPVHAHPGTDFAQARLGRRHGKAEAWYVLSSCEVYLGLKHDLHPSELLKMVKLQQVDALLGMLHRRHVNPGDTVYVPPGMLHAIGAGAFLAELQEPEDLSILLEWRDFELDGENDGHLGVGFETAISALDLKGYSDKDIAQLTSAGRFGDSILPAASRNFFSLGHRGVDGGAVLDPGFVVLIITGGHIRLHWGVRNEMRLERGSTVVVPFGAGPVEVTGHGELIECRPPTARAQG